MGLLTFDMEPGSNTGWKIISITFHVITPGWCLTFDMALGSNTGSSMIIVTFHAITTGWCFSI